MSGSNVNGEEEKSSGNATVPEFLLDKTQLLVVESDFYEATPAGVLEGKDMNNMKKETEIGSSKGDPMVGNGSSTNVNEEKTTFIERSAEMPNIKNLTTTTTLKREKSHTDTLERKKKRVKFSASDEGKEHVEIICCTSDYEESDPFESLIRDTNLVSNTLLANKLKRMLKNKSNSSGCSKDSETREESLKDSDPNSDLQDSGYECSFDIAFIDEDSDTQSNDNVKLVSNENNKNPKNSQTSLKRERTFIIDDEYKPPAKSLKFEEKTNTNRLKSDQCNVSCTGANNKMGMKDVEISLCVPSVREKTMELKLNSSAAKRRAKVNVEKSTSAADKNHTQVVIGDDKSSKSGGSFRDSAKKSLMNAWKAALKNSTNETKIPTMDADFHTVDLTNKSTSRVDTDESMSGLQQLPDVKNDDQIHPKRDQSSKNKETQAVKSSKLVGTVLPFRKDGPMNRKTKLQFDNEKSKLEAEIRKLNAENTRYVIMFTL